MSNNASIDQLLIKLDACLDAAAWAKGKSLSVIWRTCPYGDWMLWLVTKVGIDRRKIVLCAADCAELLAKHWESDSELACIWAIDSARRWACGDADIDEVQAATAAACTAACTANAAHYAAANVFTHAGDVAHYVADCTVEAAYAHREATRLACARIVRRRIPLEAISMAIAEAS